MVNEPRTFAIDPESELGRAVADVILERGRVRYRVSRADDPWADYDPDNARAGLRAHAGMITDDQAERMKAQVYLGREDGARSLRRP